MYTSKLKRGSAAGTSNVYHGHSLEREKAVVSPSRGSVLSELDRSNDDVQTLLELTPSELLDGPALRETSQSILTGSSAEFQLRSFVGLGRGPESNRHHLSSVDMMVRLYALLPPQLTASYRPSVRVGREPTAEQNLHILREMLHTPPPNMTSPKKDKRDRDKPVKK